MVTWVYRWLVLSAILGINRQIGELNEVSAHSEARFLKPNSAIHELRSVDKLSQFSEAQFSPLLSGDNNKTYLKD